MKKDTKVSKCKDSVRSMRMSGHSYESETGATWGLGNMKADVDLDTMKKTQEDIYLFDRSGVLEADDVMSGLDVSKMEDF